MQDLQDLQILQHLQVLKDLQDLQVFLAHHWVDIRAFFSHSNRKEGPTGRFFFQYWAGSGRVLNGKAVFRCINHVFSVT